MSSSKKQLVFNYTKRENGPSPSDQLVNLMTGKRSEGPASNPATNKGKVHASTSVARVAGTSNSVERNGGRRNQFDGSARKFRRVEDKNPWEHTLGTYLVKISHCEGPGVVYVQSVYREPQLRHMETDMMNYLERSVVNCHEVLVEAVLRRKLLGALLLDKNGGKMMRRVFVYRLISEKQVAKVIYVDYGDKANVNFKNLRILPYFLQIHTMPTFIQRVHLNADARLLRMGKWTTNAKNQFNKLVESMPDYRYCVEFKPGRDLQVSLADYNQDVWLDSETQLWFAGGHLTDYPVLSKEAQELFKHTLMTSYRVDLAYPDNSIPMLPKTIKLISLLK